MPSYLHTPSALVKVLTRKEMLAELRRLVQAYPLRMDAAAAYRVSTDTIDAILKESHIPGKQILEHFGYVRLEHYTKRKAETK
jgi:hypothetical protein